MNCPFCAIAREEPERVLAENKHAAVILSNPRQVRGHCLVIPKRHVEYPGDLDPNEQASIFSLIEKVRSSLLQSELAEGVDVRQHYRPWLPESRFKVDHIHFHVLPRNPEDQIHEIVLRHEIDLFADLSEDERTEITDILNL